MDMFLVDDRRQGGKIAPSMQAMVTSGFCHGLVIVGTFILVLVFFLSFNGALRRARSTAAAACDDNRVVSDDCLPLNSVCQVGYLVGNGCIQELATSGTVCDDACYVDNANSTVCTKNGQCVGNQSECRGHCTADSDCNTTIPFNTDWLTQTAGFIEDTEHIVYTYRHRCYYNRCELFVIDRVAQARPFDPPAAVAAYATCEEYLDSTFTAVRGKCLHSERQLLDTNITDVSHFLADPTQAAQFSLCLYYYDCATLNQTAIGL